MRTFIQILVGNGFKPNYRLEEIKIAFNKYLNQQTELLSVSCERSNPLILAKVKEINHPWFDELVKCSSKVNVDGIVRVTLFGSRRIKPIHKSKLEYLLNNKTNESK